jgi:hypothetical protein
MERKRRTVSGLLAMMVVGAAAFVGFAAVDSRPADAKCGQRCEQAAGTWNWYCTDSSIRQDCLYFGSGRCVGGFSCDIFAPPKGGLRGF